MNYTEFLKQKELKIQNKGIEVKNVSDILFDFQQDLVKWALKKGKAAIFSMTGTGKTLMQLEWARHIPGKVLILAPLAVTKQTQREGEKLGLKVNICESQDDATEDINITNYEKIGKFGTKDFAGVVLDESSILKNFDGKTKQKIIDNFLYTPYKLACTATPAPNDYMELGNHAEFLNIMTQSQMLSSFFINDGATTQKWRLKGHAYHKFWEWVSSWGVVVNNPNDLGYTEQDFTLPELRHKEHTIEGANTTDRLFVTEAETLTERRQARKESLEDRVKKCAEIVNSTDEQFIVWCDLNKESELLAREINGAVEVKGGDKDQHKESSMLDFSEEKIRVLVTKPSIAGFGMNWQNCNNMAFVGLSDSFEKYFQAVRRCWRFGQDKPVNVHIIISEKEGSVLKNIKRKQHEFETMINEVTKLTKDRVKESIKEKPKTKKESAKNIKIPEWLRGDDFETRSKAGV